MLTLIEETHSKVARVTCLQRLAGMLIEAGTVRPEVSSDELYAVCAVILDDGEARGIKTERLLGVYLLFRISDGIDPFEDHEFANVLQDTELSEASKAHKLQMVRLNRLI